MSHERNSVYVVVILIALLGMLLSCCWGMFGGFIAGGWQARAVARRYARFESQRTPFPPGWVMPEEGEKPPSRSPRVAPTPESSIPPVEEPSVTEVVPDAFWEAGYSAGALLLEVNAGSPAQKAGLRRGDIIVAVDGKALKPEAILSDVIKSYEPGDKVKIDFWRREKDRSVDVTLAENQENADQAYLGVLFVPIPPPEIAEEDD